MMKYIFYIVILLFLALTGCLENPNSPKDYFFSDTADLLAYFETNGNFINSNDNPALINVDEVYNNLEDVLIIDIREKEKFDNGHIEGSLNSKIENILDTLSNKNINNYNSIVIVSETGQKAAYVTSLLRLYGIENVYSMNYGVGQWNEHFADVWINARKDPKIISQIKLDYYPKPDLSNKLPTIGYDKNLDYKDFAKARIKSLLTEDAYSNSISTMDELQQKYYFNDRIFKDSFIIFCGDESIYNIKLVNKEVEPGPVVYGGHLITSVFYNPDKDFKSSESLMTIPIDKTIYIYSINGQLSSYFVAYLRILGYDARSIRFGSVGMNYYYLKLRRFEDSFQEVNIRNYPYVN